MTDPSLIAAAPTSSAFVRANAGSGKTHILVTRLVRLLLAGNEPEKLLCLTYTRSAAAEMKNRLFQLLSQWALYSDVELSAAIFERLGITPDAALLPKARVLFARALETPGGLKVQTIHAFCESLLKRFPLEAGVPPQFELLDASATEVVQARLALRLLHDAPLQKRASQELNPPELRDALALITRELNQEDMMLLVRDIVAHRGDFVPKTLNKIARALTIRLDEKTGAPLIQPEDIINDFSKAHKEQGRDVLHWLADVTAKTDLVRAQQLQDWLGGIENIESDAQDTRSAWHYLVGFFLDSKGLPRNNILTKSYMKAHSDWEAPLQEWQEEFVGVHKAYLAAHTYQMTAAVYCFATHFLQDYAREKQRLSRLDYDDLIECTHTLLRGRAHTAWVLYKIDQGLTHILVDEAQDTSPSQWRVIASLVEEFFAGAGAEIKTGGQNQMRTIFAVGDEKQSIFSFQGADPAAFDKQFIQFKTQIEAAAETLHDVPLVKSWRSAPAILEFVDKVFIGKEKALGQGKNSIHHVAHRSEAYGLVELWQAALTPATPADAAPIWQQATDGVAQAATQTGRLITADKIADKIATLMREGYRPSDVLILVRKRDAFVDDMMRALKRRAIAVSGADRMILTDQIIIMDLMALAEFACTPHDDLNLACFLRSPFGGVSEEALFELAHYRSDNQTLWHALEAAGKGEAAQTTNSAASFAPAIKMAYERCHWALAQIDFKSPFDFFTSFLSMQFGGTSNPHSNPQSTPHSEAIGRLGTQIDDPIGEFLRECLAYEAQHPPTMQGFLHNIRQGAQAIKRDMEEGGAVVRIMTIHGAKGLEAPIVFLPDTCAASSGTAGRNAPLLKVKDMPPLWRMAQPQQDVFGLALRGAEKEAAQEESQRLLYVALTRACDRLYIGGYMGKGRKNIPEDSWYQQIADTLQKSQYEIDSNGEKVWRLQDTHNEANNKKEILDDKTEAETETGAPYDLPAWAHQKVAPLSEEQAATYFGGVWQAPSNMGANLGANVESGRPDKNDKDANTDDTTTIDSSEMLYPLALEDNKTDDLATLFLRGTLTHKLLEILPDYEAVQWPQKAQAIMAHYAASHEEAFEAAEQKAIISEVMVILQNPEFAFVFGVGSRAEVPICGKLMRANGKPLYLNGQIDRYCETDEAIVLIDYKSGSLNRAHDSDPLNKAHDSASLNKAHDSAGHLLGQYHRQMACYRALVAATQKADSAKPIRCGLLSVRGAHLEMIDDTILDAALTSLLGT